MVGMRHVTPSQMILKPETPLDHGPYAWHRQRRTVVNHRAAHDLGESTGHWAQRKDLGAALLDQKSYFKPSYVMVWEKAVNLSRLLIIGPSQKLPILLRLDELVRSI